MGLRLKDWYFINGAQRRGLQSMKVLQSAKSGVLVRGWKR